MLMGKSWRTFIMRMSPGGDQRPSRSRRMSAKFYSIFFQMVLYAFGAFENFALTIQTAVHGTSCAANYRRHHLHLSARASVQNASVLDLNGGSPVRCSLTVR